MNNLFDIAKGFAADPKNMQMMKELATAQNLSLVSDALKENKKEQKKLQKKQHKLQKEQLMLENVVKSFLK